MNLYLRKFVWIACLAIGVIIGAATNGILYFNANIALTVIASISLIVGMCGFKYQHLLRISIGVLIGTIPFWWWSSNVLNLLFTMPIWLVWSITILLIPLIYLLITSIGWVSEKFLPDNNLVISILNPSFKRGVFYYKSFWNEMNRR